jgi:hypothetical protein
MDEATEAGHDELTSFVDMEKMEASFEKLKHKLVEVFKVCG